MSAAALRQSACDGKLWSLAAALAISLHLGAAAALLTLRPEPEGDETGAPAIEISLAPAAAHILDAPDVAPGSLADEAAAAASSAASATEREIDQPKVTRAEAEDAEFTRGEKSDKPIEKTLLTPQAKSAVSSEFERFRSDRATKIGGNARSAQTCRPSLRSRQSRAGGETYVAESANGTFQPPQALSRQRPAAHGRSQHRIYARPSRPSR